jgi:DNA topoisomerase-1
MKLIIVESPHKCDTIGKFLGSDYLVVASKGHIRDLASSGKMGLGVDVDHDFKPTYAVSPDKVAVVKELKADLAKADDVYLATDPDREGEAISWHLAQVLNLDVYKTKRLEFHEITKPAILKALQNPRTIDLKLVESQETRRIIDRLMGYRLSYLLQKKIKSRSAGRVQSVVLKFIVDREKEIKAFVPVEYWSIAATFEDGLKADLASYLDKPIKINNEDEANKVIAALPASFVIKSLKTETKYREPKPPFITSTMQQEAFSQFHFSIKKTSAVAQKLYEGKEINGTSTGLITYMRTDSTRLSDEFKASSKDFITNRFGANYLGKVHMQKADKNIQDAHEAIRPTDLSLTPSVVKDSLTKDEYQLYSLIYDRALASLMAPKATSVSTVVLDGNGYGFTTSASQPVFDGYTKVYGKYEDQEEPSKLPELKEGQSLVKKDVTKEQHFTKAPARYNEGKVVKLMQENGIGRPSTYSPTVTTLIDRDYVENQKGSLVPTEQGSLTADKLEEYFPKYMDVSYTAKMENDLDSIADGKTDKLGLLKSFWEEFQNYFNDADSKMDKIAPKEVGRNCPKCGAPLVIRHGRFGDFVGCSNYPKCDYIEKPKPDVVAGKVCPKCGAPLVKRHGRRGEFIGCSNYPKCTYMESLDGKEISTEKKPLVIPQDAPLCPSCHTGHLIEKTSRWGKKFIGCSNYPKCHYIKPEPGQEKTSKKKAK